MRTGRFRFIEKRRWWQSRGRQVLYVEVSTPGDQSCSYRVRSWIPGSASDACTIEQMLAGKTEGSTA